MQPSPEKLTVLTLVKKFPAFYGTQKFITVFTSVWHLSLPWTIWIHALQSYLFGIHFNTVLHLRPGLPSGLLKPQPCMHFLFSTTRATRPAHLILLDLITQTIPVEEYKSCSSSSWNFTPLSCYFLPFRSKYLPRHPLLKHPPPMYFPRCAVPSSTHTYKTSQIMVLYILIIMFLDCQKTEYSGPNDIRRLQNPFCS
jgi:hypothetical protein